MLKPYGLKQLLGLNAFELLNAVIDIEAHEACNSLFTNIKDQPIDSSLILQLAQPMLEFPTYAVSEVTKAFIQAVKTAPSDTIKNSAKEHFESLISNV